MSLEDDMMKSREKVWEGIEKMSLAKMKRRQQLAKLSFETKISILMRLQSIASEINKVSGRKCRKVWEISEYHDEV